MRRKLLIIGGLLFVGSILSGTVLARAQSIRTGSSTNIQKSETVDSSLVIAGETINIAGTVQGDVYCAGQTVSITGTVRGDVMCAGQTVNVSGLVEGDIRVAGQQVRLDGRVDGSATLLGQAVSVDKSTVIADDLLITASTATVDGSVARDLGIAANTARVNAPVGRNLSGQVAQLTLGTSANIKGSIDYTSSRNLTREDGAKVAGEVKRREPKQQPNKSKWAVMPFATLAYLLISLMLVALVLVVLFPRLFEQTNAYSRKNLGLTALVGAGTLFAAPIVMVILAVTFVGLPLSFMALLAWLLLLSLSGPVTGYIVGERILSRTKYKKPFLYMLVGGAIVLVLYVVPVVNIFALLGAGVVGTGAVVQAALGERLSTKK